MVAKETARALRAALDVIEDVCSALGISHPCLVEFRIRALASCHTCLPLCRIYCGTVD